MKQFDKTTLFIFIAGILLVFFIANTIGASSRAERYGNYCGRYNLNYLTAKQKCTADSECLWKSATDPHSGKITHWCTEHS